MCRFRYNIDDLKIYYGMPRLYVCFRYIWLPYLSDRVQKLGVLEIFTFILAPRDDNKTYCWTKNKLEKE